MEQSPSTPHPTEPQPQSQSQPSSSSSLPPPSPTVSSSPNPNPNPSQNSSPNPNPTPRPLTSLQPFQQQSQNSQLSVQASQPRPPFTRPWQQQQQSSSPFSHFGSLPSASVSAPSSSSGASAPSLTTTSGSSTISVPPLQRGGIAIGVPAPPQSAPFSSSFGQQFGGLGRNSVNVPESVPSSSTSQVRQPIQGYQGMGMMGSLGSSSLVRPGGVSTHNQPRPVQPSVRPQSTPNNQTSTNQNFQGHGLLRVSSVGSPSSPSPNTSQSMASHNQPWLSSGSQGKPTLPPPSSSGSQGKPPLPSPSFKPQMNQLQQRSHIPQQHNHSLTTASQQQPISSSQQSQQPSPSHQQENHGQQFAPFRAPLSLPQRVQGAGNQKPSSLAMIQPSTSQAVPQGKTANTESGESCNTILSKRSIHELVNQIDSSEKLDPDVEDILVDIADEFVDSITTFGCSLAKHRKSSILEAKDILLHLERNWNMTLPGFSGDEIKTYRKPIANDIHKERLAVIKKSTETGNTKSSAGQAVGSARGHLAKAPANPMES